MRLKEYQGKEIFRKYGINIPKGFVISKLSDLNKKLNTLKSSEYTVKAQILIGKRGKLGAVKFADKKKITFFRPNKKELVKIFNDSKYKKELVKITQKLFQIILDYDAILVEINPLI